MYAYLQRARARICIRLSLLFPARLVDMHEGARAKFRQDLSTRRATLGCCIVSRAAYNCRLSALTAPSSSGRPPRRLPSNFVVRQRRPSLLLFSFPQDASFVPSSSRFHPRRRRRRRRSSAAVFISDSSFLHRGTMRRDVCARATRALLNLHSGHEICISCRTTVFPWTRAVSAAVARVTSAAFY